MVSLAEKIHRSFNVLLVDDNLGDVTLITEVFKNSKRNILVTRAKDGEEALRLLKKEGKFAKTPRPDLILLDLNMPKMPGFEVLGEIKKDPRLKDIPVVVMTNSRLDSDLQKAYESRANFYIVKPADLDELFVALRYVEDTWLQYAVMEAE